MGHFKQNAKWYFLGVLVIAVILIWSVVIAHERQGELIVHFLDVGQGDATLIVAPNGNRILIDGGPNKGVLRELGKVMPFYDRSIDVVIATHPDQDHIGGLPDVITRYNVQYFFEPGVESDTGAYRALLARLEGKGIERTLARRGTVIHLDEGITLTILFPDRDVAGIDSNTASVIARLVYGETEFLFTGDSPKSIEKYVVALDGKDLESDVLKIGHHGSKTSTDVNFVGFINPEYAIISAGKDNRYGHPHQEVLDILTQFEIEVRGTYDEGTITFTSDGVEVQ